jgi:alkanesulfonate monooxygenase SsuD/methylene tetrahydromethanopterin reductase-like flavin-dependent oxidoreductase (luciferase family)
VEFAQASLTLNALSGGRFEPGLGAGWAEDEMTRTGRAYPDGPTRVTRYREAMTIVRELLHTGMCRFEGEYYRVDIHDPGLAGVSDPPPPLVGAASGPRALREITPLVDRMEIKANGRATRGGKLDMKIYATITEEEIREAVARARAVRDDLPLNTFVLTGAGDDDFIRGMQNALGDCFLARFVGAPAEVARALFDLEDLGIERVQLTPLTATTLAALHPLLGLTPLADSAA